MAQNRFMVPQYIETEPKILGPITVRQFVIILVAGIHGFALFKVFEFVNQTAGIILVILQTLIYGVFAFTKINGQNFHYFVLNIVRTFKRPRLKVWRKEVITSLPEEEEKEEVTKTPTKTLPTKSRLSDIALQVDTGGAYNAKFTKGNGSQKNTEESELDEMDI